MIEVKVPVFPESVADGTLSEWHKQEGESVSEGDVIAEIETDKVVLEVPAIADGVLTNVKKQAGDIVLSEETLGFIADSVVETKKEVIEELTQESVSSVSEEIDINAPVFPESVADGTISAWNKQEGESVSEGDVIAEIETDKVVLEVPAIADGVVSKILKAEGDTVLSSEIIAKLNAGAIAVSSPVNENKAIESNNNEEPHLVPSARKEFNASNLNSAKDIQGTGPKGRITSQDVKNASSKTVSAKPQAQQPSVEALGSSRYEKRVKMTRLRKTIANRLVDVQHTNAILTTFNEVDMSAVMNLRKKYKDIFLKEHDTKLGFMSFFLKASTEALKKFPDVNASIDGDDIVYHNYFDIGIAVGTDRGLVVPILRDTDTKNLAELEADVLDKAIKGRDGKLGLDDMKGGTFTITNGGTYGSMLSTPIINSPQSAIFRYA